MVKGVNATCGNLRGLQFVSPPRRLLPLISIFASHLFLQSILDDVAGLPLRGGLNADKVTAEAEILQRCKFEINESRHNGYIAFIQIVLNSYLTHVFTRVHRCIFIPPIGLDLNSSPLERTFYQ